MLYGLLWLIVYDACFVQAYAIKPWAGAMLLLLLPIAYFSVQFMRWWSNLLMISQRPQYIVARRGSSAAGRSTRVIACFSFHSAARTFPTMSTQAPAHDGQQLPQGARIGIVAARFNAAIVDELLSGCERRLKELGSDSSHITTVRVPGAFELPLAAQAMARTKKFVAVICLGAVVRGDTPHFDYVAGECARGITRVALDESLPVIFGVLTTNTQQQALDRIGGSHGHAGERAAEAAVEMVGLMARLSGDEPCR